MAGPKTLGRTSNVVHENKDFLDVRSTGLTSSSFHNNMAIEMFSSLDKVIYFIGNGGSAVTATHFANDIGVGTRGNGLNPFKVMSLTDNLAILTAISNDESFDNVFVRQLEPETGLGWYCLSSSPPPSSQMSASERPHQLTETISGKPNANV